MAAPGIMLQLDPFHCSTTSVRLFPFTSVAYPTAMQLDAEAQLTLERMAPTTPGALGVGLGTMDHDAPFHCSMRVPVGFPLPDPTTAPTAQQSEPLMQVAPKSPPPSPPGNGTGTSVHVVPFQDSISGLADDGLPPPRFIKVMPTAQHWTALAHAELRRTSSAPVPGTVETYQPDVAASAFCVEPSPVMPSSAVASRVKVEIVATPRRTCPVHGKEPERRLIHHGCTPPGDNGG